MENTLNINIYKFIADYSSIIVQNIEKILKYCRVTIANLRYAKKPKKGVDLNICPLRNSISLSSQKIPNIRHVPHCKFITFAVTAQFSNNSAET